MSCQDQNAHQALEQLFTGELSQSVHVWLRAHVSGCADCRQTYDKLTRVDAQLEKASSGLPNSRMELLRQQVVAKAVAQQSAAQASVWTKVRRWLVPAGGLAVAGLALMLFLPREEHDDGFQARGPAEDGEAKTFGVRAFCVTPGAAGSEPTVFGEARPGERLKCPAGKAVQFTYTTPQKARLTIAAPTPAGDWLTFLPSSDPKSQVAQGTDVPLRFSTPVTPEWLNGPTEVKARFEDPATGALLSETTLTLEP